MRCSTLVCARASDRPRETPLDPDRVKRGAVNSGDFDADMAADDAALTSDVAGKTTLPVDKGDEADCKVRMRRLGPDLLVDDSNACGG